MPYIHTRDHTRVFYLDAGAGRPIVFIASAWLDSRMWEFQIPYLVDHGFRCIAYDRRGHGRSDGHGTATTTTRSPMTSALCSIIWISAMSRWCRTRPGAARSCDT